MIEAKDIKEFDAIGKRLVRLMQRIKRYNPDAEIFMEAESGLMLFDGPARPEDGEGFNWDLQKGKSHWTKGMGCGAI